MELSEKKMGMAFFGLILASASIGAMYHVRLVIFGYFILLAGLLLTINHVYAVMASSYEKEGIERSIKIAGIAGVVLLALFFGVQSSHLPAKEYVLVGGIALIVPAFVEVLGGKK